MKTPSTTTIILATRPHSCLRLPRRARRAALAALLSVCALLFASASLPAAAPVGKLYWDPLATGGTGAGGSGTWDTATANWWTGAAPYTWISGVAGSVTTYTDLYFGGAGQGGAPYEVTLALDALLAPSIGSAAADLYAFKLNFDGDYTIKTNSAQRVLIGGATSGPYVYFDVMTGAGKTVTFDGTGQGITLQSYGNNSNTPSVLFGGGGTMVLQNNTAINQNHVNGRITIGRIADPAPTRLVLADDTVQVNGSRIWVDNGTLDINGANVVLANTLTTAGRSTLHIGNAKAALPSVINLNSGTLTATMTYAAAQANYGLLFGNPSATVGDSGGTFNLNGGVFETTDIGVVDTTGSTAAHFVFNGGTLRVSGAAVTNQLNRFIAGFGGASQTVIAGTGGAFIDTTDATASALVSAAISGSGNVVKLGANTLQFTATQAYTGTTIVRGGVLSMNVVDAIASSRAVVVEAGAVLNGAGGGVTQTLRNLSGSGTLTNGSGRLIAFNDAGESSTFAGSLTLLGSGGFGKSGSGTFILVSDNSAVTRGTLVSAGKLLLGDAANARLGGLVTVETGAIFGGLGAATGTVALDTGAILQSGTGVAGGTLTVATLRLNAGSILGFDIGAGDVSGTLNVTSPLVFATGSAAGIIINLNSLISGTYTLGNGNLAAGLTGSGSAAVTYAGALIGGRQSAILTNQAGSLQLALDAGSSLKVIWTGATDAIWNTTGTNWKKDAAADEVPFAPGDAVVFDDSLTTARRDITLASAITVSDLTVGGTGNYSLAGFSITADAAQAPGLAGVAGRLIMESTGTLTLAPDAVNNFKGGIELKAGALRAATDGALGASNLNVVNDAALLVDTAALAAGGTFTLAAGKTLALNTTATAAAELSGKITGGGTLAKTGPGALLLAGANDHAATVLSGGTLAFGHDAALGATLAAGASGATLRADLANFSASAAMTIGAHTVTFDTGTNNGAWTGGITGSGTLVKTGAGTLEIAAAALAAAVGLDIGEGKIRLAQTAAGNHTLANNVTSSAAAATLAVRLAGASSGTLALGAGALSGFAGTLAIEDASFVLDATSAAEFSTASLGVGAGSRIDKTAGGMSIAGLTLDGGTIQFAMNGVSPDGILTIGALNTGSAGAETSVMMDLGSGGGFTQFNPAVPPATNILDHDNGSATGEKIIAVTGAITGAGALKLTGTDGNPVAGSITSVLEQYVPGGDTLKEAVADATYSAALVTGSDGVYLGSALTAISVYDGKQLILDNSAPGVDNTFAIGISGPGGLRVLASGSIVLSGSNTYTGVTTLASGVTRATRADIFKDSASVAIEAGAAFETGGNAQTLRHLSGGGAIDLGGAALTLAAADDSATEFTGALTGAGNIIKTGSGALTLSGVSARGAGTTGINDGRLVIKNNLSALGSGAASFSSSTAVLEFNTITSGTHNLAITGGGIVEVRDSNFVFGNSGNRLSEFHLINSTVLPTASVHALGSTTAHVRIDSTSALYVSYGHSTTANALRVGNVTVAAGGKLLYGLNGAVNKFDLTGGVLTLEDGAVIGFAGRVADGIYDLVEDGFGTVDRQGAIVLEKGPNKMVQWRATDNDDIELITLSFDPTVQVSMTFDAMMAAMSAVYNRMSESFLLPVIEANRASKINGLWMRGFASSAEYDETSDQYGHTEDTYGMVVGFDALSKNRKYLMGVYGGFAAGTLETGAGARGEADQQFAGLYGAAKWGKFYIGLDGMAGWSKSGNTRHQADGGVSEGTSNANYYGGSVETGLVFQPTQTFTLKPAVGLHYLNAGFGACKERGDSAIAYPDIDRDLLQSLVSVQAGWKFTTPWGWPGMADLAYAWRRNISEKSGDITVRFISDTTQAPYAIRAGDYARDGHVIGGGIRGIVSDSLSLGLAYDFEIAGHRTRHTVNGTVRWSW